MKNWEPKLFKDIAQFPPKVSMERGQTYSFIPMEDVSGNYKYVAPTTEKKWTGGGAKFENGDTLFARITPCLQNGKIAQAKDLKDGKGFGSTEYFIFRGIDKVSDSDFIYYIAQTDEFRKYAIGSMVGASGRQRADAKFVGNFELKCPPLPIQKRIASILSAYDDSIENNLKRIKLLEEIAQRTYEEWFVKFRINGKQLPIDKKTGLPEGWEFKRADELFDIKIGKTPPRDQEQWFCKSEEGVKWASIKDINNSNVFISDTSEGITEFGVDKYNMNTAKTGTIILSFKLTVGKVVILTENMTTNEAIAHFNEINGLSPCNTYSYCYLKSFNYDKLGSTSSIGTALNSKIVKAMPFLLPQIKIIKGFELKIKPLFDQIKNLINQNQHLKT
ncbi:MAG: restriction endonuclease subunit S, partial [Bacteroidota bacterium]